MRHGFRAERARPVALVAGRRWPRPAREAVAELAALYGAELLVASGPRELLAFAEERGGALSEERVAELLPEPETEPEVAAQGQSAAGGAAAPPRTSGGRLRTVGNALLGIFQMLFQVFAFLLFAGIQLVFALAMLGFGVGVVGGILFGWFETEPRKPPARVESVQFDRERCVIHANVVARRRLGHLDLRVAGRLGNGDGMGHFEERVGPVERGRSRILVAKPDSSLCRSHHTFTTRVRPVWPELKGKPSRGEIGAVASGIPRATDRTRAMTLPGPSRTIIVEPIEQPERSPAQPDPEPATEPAPEPEEAPAEPAPEREREKEPAGSPA